MGKPSSRSNLTSKAEGKSKAEHKFEKKLQFYAKVRATAAAALNAKCAIGKKKLRSRQKKLKPYDLSALSDHLPEVGEPKQKRPTPEFKLSCKSRVKLILNEGKQLSEVLNHPAFQANPLASIQQHLESTQPVMDEKTKRRTDKHGGKKIKGKKTRASVTSDSMEI